MPYLDFKGLDIHYEHQGDAKTPLIVFANGLSQRTQHWDQYAKYLTERGYQVLTFDLLGQGGSSKPVLGYDFNDNQEVVARLMDRIEVEQGYIMGISFGGIVALRFGFDYPGRCKGLIPTSTFSEMDFQLLMHGMNMYKAMVVQGFDFLLDMLLAVNFSSHFLKQNEKLLPVLKRTSMAYNDYYAIQNLIESLQHFVEFTPRLREIKAPALILNGEWDNLTPRWCHDVIRQHLVHSRLMIVQHGYHAFTLEFPAIVCRIIADFVDQVESGRWVGDQTVWIAEDDPQSKEIAFPCGDGDHLRNLPISLAKSRSTTTGRYERFPLPPGPENPKYSGT